MKSQREAHCFFHLVQTRPEAPSPPENDNKASAPGNVMKHGAFRAEH